MRTVPPFPRLRLLTTAVLMLVLALPAFADEPPSDVTRSILESKVDRLFVSWDRSGSPGAAVLVMRGDEILYRRGYGSAQLEYEIPITPATVFHIASISKQFTAFAIHLLEQQGKLSLDDDVRLHIPEVPDFGKTITLRHLIHHTSGLRDQWELLILGGWRLDDVITHDQIMTMVRHQRELNFDPGEEHLYCNTGYTLLAEVVHRVTGRSLREWTQANVFEPLGMTSTHFHDDHEMIVKNRAYSYQPDGDGFKKSVLSYANVGATSLFTTVEDMAKWIHNLRTGMVGGRALIAAMQVEGRLNDGSGIGYASGLVPGEHRGLRTVGHGGADAGFRTAMTIYPDQDFAVVVFSNLSSFTPGGVAQQVAEIYLADAFPPAAEGEGETRDDETAAAEIDPALYDRYAGHYLFEDGTVMILAREDDHLVRKIQGRPDVVLVPRSETEFDYSDRDLSFRVERDAEGRVTKLDYPTLEITAEPFEAWEPTPEEIAGFTGEYWSDEVGTTYTLLVVDGKLVARHRRMPDLPLAPSRRDQFFGDLATLRFERDEEGRVVGMLATTGRVRNLRFERRSAL